MLSIFPILQIKKMENQNNMYVPDNQQACENKVLKEGSDRPLRHLIILCDRP